MRRQARLGFKVKTADLRSDILVPRYYDPEIAAQLDALAKTHELVSIGELIECGDLVLSQGKYVPKINYGTGPVPYIRTSDIANWELRASPKHGLSEDIYLRYADEQDVQAGDILMVHEGTYLIGTVCLLTEYDTRIVFQHHLARLRVTEGARVTPEELFAALMTPIVLAQIRARQFTADIIDSVVGRLPEVVLPLPRRTQAKEDLARAVKKVFQSRAKSRIALATVMTRSDEYLRTGRREALTRPVDTAVALSGIVSLLGDRPPRSAFTLPSKKIVNDVLVPQYYDPGVADDLDAMRSRCELRSVGDLVEAGVLELQTGNEVGKLAYGTGQIPFVRTSDLGNWELKHDPKQRVSDEIYQEFSTKQDVQAGDILIVRDGTYLVGTSVLVTESDIPMLFSGGIIRMRSDDWTYLPPGLLLLLLNTRTVWRQIQSKRFTRDVIDTLGTRLAEVVLPIPKDISDREWLGTLVSQELERRRGLREWLKELGERLQAPDWDADFLAIPEMNSLGDKVAKAGG